MNTSERYKEFAKKGSSIVMTNNCVVYTRVSSKEQADGNASLDTQLKYCKEYAEKKGYNIVEYFGGTYESAKSDERKEFQKMLTFLKRRKNISYVLVYSYDRFSRTGANAAYISSNLKKRGIHTISVSQDVDTSKPSGVFQENLYYMFSQFDNELRKDKCVTGMQEKLRNGYWCFALPVGYDNKKKGSTADKAELVLNDTGRMIQRAFKWVLTKNWNLEKIAKETQKRGIPISSKRLSVYLRNPFYAGLITSSLIPNEVYEGKHEKAISLKQFKQVNDILDGRARGRKGVKAKKIVVETPLKGTIYCDECGTSMTAYKAYKNQKYYYKCNKRGCKNNQRAEEVHDSFRELLSYIQIDKKYKKPLELALTEVFFELNKEANDTKKMLNSTLKSIDTKLEKLEEKFLFEGVSQQMYQKHLTRLSDEKNEILRELEKPEIKLSNLDKFIKIAVDLSVNLVEVWDKQDYEKRKELQKLLFPRGIKYNRKNQLYRTKKINTLFLLNPSFSKTYKAKKEKRETVNYDFPAKVGPHGLEPWTP